MIRTTHKRRGVTLVEMMVAAAMCIAGMWLLTWLYQQGLESFRIARAHADLSAQERMVATILTRDLKADHFLEESNKPNRGRKLSDQTKWLVDGTAVPLPPRAGYFWAGSFPVAFGGAGWEGYDSDSFASTRSTNHFLQFTAVLPGGPDQNTFSADLYTSSGTKQYTGTAAEISYYLIYTGTTAGGVPLHDLVRRQRLCARTSDDSPAYNPGIAAASSSGDNPAEVMVTTSNTMRTLRDLTIPVGTSNASGLGSSRLTDVNVAMYPPASPTRQGLSNSPYRTGDDRLMGNVISFEVKFTGTSNIGWPDPFPGNSDYPYANLPYDGKFDTHSQDVTGWQNDIADASNPTKRIKPIRITGAMIRIRALDTRTKTVRQTTFTVDL